MPKQIVTPYMASQPTARVVLGRRVDTTMVALLQFRPAVAYSITAPPVSMYRVFGINQTCAQCGNVGL